MVSNCDQIHKKEHTAPKVLTKNSIRCLQIQVDSMGLSEHQHGQRSKLFCLPELQIGILPGRLKILPKFKNRFLDFGNVLRVSYVNTHYTYTV